MVNELEVAKKVIREAGKAVMSFYESDYEINYKASGSPVTEADLKSEEIIVKGLEQFNYPVMSEEMAHDLERLNAEKIWIVDPLDGTKDFIQKTGDFTIMIGLVERGEPILGVIYEPLRDRLFYAEKGKGAYLLENGKERRLKIKEVEDVSELRLLVSRNHLLKLEQDIAREFGIKEVIPCGSAGLKASLIAAGEADLYINSSQHTSEWDICASEIIINEAGGQIKDLQKRGFVYNKSNVRNMQGFLVAGKKVSELIFNWLDTLDS